MDARYLLVAGLLAGIIGCASAPIVTDMSAIVDDPGSFKNKRIEVSAPVLENSPPQGDEYRTWTFFVGSSSAYRVMASEEGFNPATIEKAYRLVESARETGDEVKIIGRLRVGPYREIRSGLEVDLESVEYGGFRVDTDRGPFVQPYYPYYPYHYPGPMFWYFGVHSYHHH